MGLNYIQLNIKTSSNQKYQANAGTSRISG